MDDSRQYYRQDSVRFVSLNLLLPRPLYFEKKGEKLTTGGKYCERRRADMSFRFQQFVLKSNERGDEVLQCVPQFRHLYTLHLQQPYFVAYDRQSFWNAPVFFLFPSHKRPLLSISVIKILNMCVYSHPPFPPWLLESSPGLRTKFENRGCVR
jgi:hypothetical protein